MKVGSESAPAFHKAGVPRDVLQVIHLSPELTSAAIKHPLVDFVSFTGSVAGGRAIDIAAAEASRFKGVGLELGGKDPAYVRADANLDYTVPELVDGTLCLRRTLHEKRIYVHESVYDEFVSKFVELTKKDRLGDPTEPETNLGPVVSVASAERIRKQVSAAVQAGAKALVPEDLFAVAQPGTAYVAPQVLVNEETFGPAVGIQKVFSDDEAIAVMNVSPYGLTASIWTDAEGHSESQEAFLHLVDELQAGTVYSNQCAYLDAWTGEQEEQRPRRQLEQVLLRPAHEGESAYMKIKTSQ
ncbi:Aldehyde/histidinol dehydrogenase [Trametes polyzona]|nr:Aldehyde/histidinol dehydrogenase [Trametes polyzona]